MPQAIEPATFMPVVYRVPSEVNRLYNRECVRSSEITRQHDRLRDIPEAPRAVGADLAEFQSYPPLPSTTVTHPASCLIPSYRALCMSILNEDICIHFPAAQGCEQSS
jgi:hypothetical protein